MKLALAVLLSFPSALAFASDDKLITPYPGSVILTTDVSEFESFGVPLGPTDNGKVTKLQELEGRRTYVELQNPDGRSPYEIYKNYEGALKKAGFQTLFTCKGSGAKAALPDCGDQLGIAGGFKYWPYDTSHYIAAKKKHQGQDIWVALDVQGPWTKINVIRPKAMETGKVEVDAKALNASIEEEGHVAVYGIEFDSNKADLKPASAPILAEIAKLLKASPQLSIYVVGHTDAVGTLESNQGLSQRRAASVVAALVKEHGIAAPRLSPHGVGPLVPLATNGSADGRAKNRRVDLVKR